MVVEVLAAGAEELIPTIELALFCEKLPMVLLVTAVTEPPE